MAINYETTVDGNTLLVRASGFDESLEDVQGYAIGIISACIQGGVTRVLCDELSLEYRLGTLDTYRAGEFLSTNAPAVARVAIVCSPQNLPDAQFFEDIVVNRGLALRVFTDIDTAALWLKESGDPSEPETTAAGTGGKR